MASNKIIKSFFLILVSMMLGLVSVQAQRNDHKRPPFNPAKFEADMEQYITTYASLTPQEAAKFFPVYRQMTRKMRTLFDAMRRNQLVNIKDDKACAEVIRQQDQIDIDMKYLQQEYHSRFMKILSPSKVMMVIKAEESFHRQAFRKMRLK